MKRKKILLFNKQDIIDIDEDMPYKYGIDASTSGHGGPSDRPPCDHAKRRVRAQTKRRPVKNLKLKAARALKGLSQAELARAVGVTRQTIGLIEAGGYNPTLNLCIGICRVLDCTLDELFWPEEEGK